jgi:lipopolysaccharide/colanic/teichoic acid biosynthesis glycosyltransferase
VRLGPHSQSRAIAAPGMRRHAAVDATTRLLDICLSTALLIALTPVVLVIAVAIKADSRGPVFYRARRAGARGVEFAMLKFRKMYDGAAGPALTAADDARFTGIGRLLARTKLDEIPQLVNVLMGEMSLVGPRPEDPALVKLEPEKFAQALTVRPGITGLAQLAFARESEILDPADRVGHYITTILPQKLALDALYTTRRSTRLYLAILAWTAFAVIARRDVAVNRGTGKLTRRRRSPSRTVAAEPSRAA